jgi:tellurite methyltransferase
LVARKAVLRPRRPRARALDLACGAGRNALYLAGLAYSVDAWDISDVALRLLRAELELRHASGHTLAVAPLRVDLQTVSLPVATYDLVLDAHFLDRSLFPSMSAAIRSGGLLVVLTLMRRADADDRNPAYLLEPGELRTAFRSLEVLEYEEDPAAGWAGLVACQPTDSTQPIAVTESRVGETVS